MPTRATWRNLEGLVPGEASHSEADPEPGWDASPPSPGVRGRAWAHAVRGPGVGDVWVTRDALKVCRTLWARWCID